MNKHVCMVQVLNKTDLLTPDQLQQATDWLLANTGAASILHTSAISGGGIDDVKEWSVAQLPLGPTLYPKVRGDKAQACAVSDSCFDASMLRNHDHSNDRETAVVRRCVRILRQARNEASDGDVQWPQLPGFLT